jgi:hypothetical protein
MSIITGARYAGKRRSKYGFTKVLTDPVVRGDPSTCVRYTGHPDLEQI